jgi:hypothetical protein
MLQAERGNKMASQLITRKGNPNKPLRVMIYGVEGCGKSTLGARSDSPVFITPEGGIDQVRTSKGELVDELPGISTWDDVRDGIRRLIAEQHQFETLVLDSADWLEKLCHAKIIGGTGKSITTANGGYGAGYRQSEILHKELIDDLAMLRDKRNMNIIVTAHCAVRTVKDPSMMDDYESFEIKCHEMVSSLWREWVDALIFVRFKTLTVQTNTRNARAVSDGTRVAFTVKQPAFQAKNRYGMNPEYQFTLDFWDTLKAFAKKGVMDLKPEILEMSKLITDKEMKKKVDDSLVEAGNDFNKLLPIRNRLKELTGGKK